MRKTLSRAALASISASACWRNPMPRPRRKNSTPRLSRFQCASHRTGSPLVTRNVSNRPSPYRKPRSKTETVAFAAGMSWPLTKTNSLFGRADDIGELDYNFLFGAVGEVLGRGRLTRGIGALGARGGDGHVDDQVLVD